MLEQMKECIRNGQQDEAMEIAENLDIKLIKNNSDINLMADLYIENGLIEKGYECLREIYGRKKTRGLLFQLINTALEMKNVKAAEKYYADYIELSGNDFYNHIFKYKIKKLKGAPIEELIPILEKLKSEEYIEAWAYELAKLYHKAGMEEKCVKECNDIEIWFGDGPYVERARMLKAYHKGELDMDRLTAEKDRHAEKNNSENAETKKDDIPETVETTETTENTETTVIDTSGTADSETNVEETFSDETAETDEYTEDPGEMWDNDKTTLVEGLIGEETETDAVTDAGTAETGVVTVVTGAETADEESIKQKGEQEPEEEAVIDVGTEIGADLAECLTEGEAETEADSVESLTEGETETEADSVESLAESETETQTNSVESLSEGETETEVKAVIKVEPEDDFAEELKEYEEEKAVEAAEININTDIPEGEDAWIYSCLEEGERELGKQIQMEFEKDREYQSNWNKEQEKWRQSKNAGLKKSEKRGTNNDIDDAMIEDSIAAALEESSSKEDMTGGRKKEDVKDKEPEEENQSANEPAKDIRNNDDDRSEESEETVVDIGALLRDVTPLDPKTLLGSFLSRRNEELEDYFEFYALQPEIRTRLVENLEFMLKPQIKNICMVITGPHENEKNAIIRGIGRLLFNSGILTNEKPFKAEAEKLNAAGLKAKSTKLLGSCFVIRSAGKMDKETAEALLELNDQFAGKTAVILSDTKSAINSLFKDQRGLIGMFSRRVHISAFNEKDLEKLAYYRIEKTGMKLSVEAQTELRNKIKEIARSEGDPAKKVSNMIEAAIDNVSTRNAKNLLRITRMGDAKFKDTNVITSKDLQ